MKEPIPLYLTPDKDRGVTYTDEIIEMKGKTVLEAATVSLSLIFSLLTVYNSVYIIG